MDVSAWQVRLIFIIAAVSVYALSDATRPPVTHVISVKKEAKERITVNGFPSHSYGTPLAIWDQGRAKFTSVLLCGRGGA